MRFGFFIIVITALSLGDLHAQSRLCQDLENQLATLQNGNNITNRSQYRRYDRAYHKQHSQLIKMQREALRAGCRNSGLRIFQSTQCRKFNQTISQMRANLQKIEIRRNRFIIDPRHAQREKQELILALGRNRCGPQYERIARAHDGRNRVTIFGRDPFFDQFDEPQVRGYRTICVRTCDGYYFPISFSTLSRHFARDEAKCKAMFPKTNVQLFYHRSGINDALQTARSLDGKSYPNMPYAFQFRQSYNKACRFDRANLQHTLTHQDSQQVRSNTQQVHFGQKGPVPPVRPDFWGEDPETMLNEIGHFQSQPQPIPQELAQNPKIRRGEKVRIVGPSFFYGQSKVGVLSYPVQTQVQ